MLTRTIVTPEMSSMRTTHDDYSDHVAKLSRETKQMPSTFVQVQFKGVTVCGQVRDLARFERSQADWFKVRTPLSTGWFPSSKVRLCSGLDDQLCTCECVATVIHQPGECL